MSLNASWKRSVKHVFVRAVCFDLGGVLIRICGTWGEALGVCGLQSQNPAADLSLSSFPGLEAHQSGALTEEQYFEQLAQYLGLSGSDEAVRVHEGIVKEEYHGAFEFVRELNENGLSTGCLSNTNEYHWRQLLDTERFPVMSELQVRLASHELALNKPDPEVFRRFEEEARVEGPEIVYFDDTAGHVEAAKSLGWRAYLIDPAEDPIAQMRQALRTELLLDDLHA